MAGYKKSIISCNTETWLDDLVVGYVALNIEILEFMSFISFTGNSTVVGQAQTTLNFLNSKNQELLC